MTNCEEVQARLSEFTDGLLPPETHAAVLTHVRACADCSGVLHDLERLISVARELGPVTPPEHLWLEIAGHIRLADGQAIRLTPPASAARAVWQWVGLSAALLAITAALYFFSRHAPAPPTVATNAAPTGSMQAVTDELSLAMQHYERAIAELEAAARTRDGQMDPAVSATLHDSLGSIDTAISESRAALVSNPDSDPARDSLFEALRQKISVLQATVSLINEMRQGDPSGAARAMEGRGRQS
ncbi:MAG: zf-HC2 domain-containing protein [Acidobacteriota bacterium]